MGRRREWSESREEFTGLDLSLKKGEGRKERSRNWTEWKETFDTTIHFNGTST